MNPLLIALRTKIATSGTGSGFAATFSGRVYYDAAPADTAFPCCVYTATQSLYERHFGAQAHTVTVSFTFFEGGADLFYANLASSRLKTLLDNVDLSASGYSRALCLLRQRGGPDFADDVWSTTDVYDIVGFVKD